MTWRGLERSRLPRPLDPVRSIKLKLGVVVVAVGVTVLVFFWWRSAGCRPRTPSPPSCWPW